MNKNQEVLRYLNPFITQEIKSIFIIKSNEIRDYMFLVYVRMRLRTMEEHVISLIQIDF